MLLNNNTIDHIFVGKYTTMHVNYI
jgi:hypothetical protein